MNIKDYIKDKTCYVVSKELKKEILHYISENKLIFDIHFFSLQDFIDRCYFSYDNKAIYYTSKELNISYDNAKQLINNLKYLIYSTSIEDSKYTYLYNLKLKLDNNKLLKYDERFLSYLAKYNIISDLNPGNEFLYKINEILNMKIQFIKLEEKQESNIYEFEDSENEIAFLANYISSLIKKGIPADKIHILNSSSAYYPYIEKIFTLYKIPFSIENDNFLYNLPYIQKLYDEYIEGRELTNKNLELTNEFNSIVNSTLFINDTLDRNNYLLYLLKNTLNKKEKYVNCINFSSYQSTYLDNNYYFLIGMNNKVFPSLKKDEDFLSDSIKSKLGYIPSYKINELTREYCLNRIKSNTNLILSYRKNDYFNSYMPSDLINYINKNNSNNTLINTYSLNYDKLKLTEELDDFYKYDEKSNELLDLLTKLSKDEYQTYNNSYKKIKDTRYINDVINNKISISYSSFEKFNECHYKYYLDSVLKEREDRFTTYIGNLFHYVLESIYDDNFNFDSTIKKYNDEYVLSNKEEILLTTLLDDFKDKIKIILDQYNRGNYKKIKKEQNISIRVKSKLSININGFIDKIMLDDDNHAYIVDYKTGDTKLTLDYLDYGLKCQLPFYFYLLNKSEEYANIFLVGCYLQVINLKIKNYKDSNKELLLEGLTIKDADLISGIDNFYNENSFIKGIKPNKNGLGTYAKTFTTDDFNHIIDKMDININQMIEDISNVNFDISPKIIKKDETTCLYCKYKDICYRKFKDYVDIRKVPKNELD